MQDFVIPMGQPGEMWWDGLPTLKEIWGRVVEGLAEDAVNFADSIGFDANAMAHAYVAAELGYGSPYTTAFSRSGYPTVAEYLGFAKEIITGVINELAGTRVRTH